MQLRRHPRDAFYHLRERDELRCCIRRRGAALQPSRALRNVNGVVVLVVALVTEGGGVFFSVSSLSTEASSSGLASSLASSRSKL